MISVAVRLEGATRTGSARLVLAYAYAYALRRRISFANRLRAGNILPVKVTRMTDGDTAWLLISAALVMLMTPGLALFYGGMVQSKNVLSTFMHSFFALGLVTVQFALIGYSLSFGDSWHGIHAEAGHPGAGPRRLF